MNNIFNNLNVSFADSSKIANENKLFPNPKDTHKTK